MSSTIREYDAFISYRHLEWDMAVAKKLQELLEKQKIKEDNKETRTLKIFRDQSELPSSDDLGGEIRAALENSRYLIVLCSKTYQESKWCMEEIAYFRSLHGGTNKRILPILLEGEPSESFPEMLCYEETAVSLPDGGVQTIKKEIEPLAADIRADSLHKAQKRLKSKEIYRIAAPILGMAFDDLYQRKKRARRRMLASLATGVMAVFLAFFVYNWHMLAQIQDRQSKLLENESVRLASAAESEIDNGDYMLALLLADQAYSFHREAGIKEDNSKAAAALQSAVLASDFEQNVQAVANKAVIPFQTSDWRLAGSLKGGKILQISDGDATYLCDTEAGEKLYTFQGGDYAFNDEASLGVEISVPGANKVMFRGISVESGDVYFEHQTDLLPPDLLPSAYKDNPEVLFSVYKEAFYDDETGNCYLDVNEEIHWYVTKDGEIVVCDFDESKESGLPASVQKKIENKHNFDWDYSRDCYTENYDIDLDYPGPGVKLSSDERHFLKLFSGAFEKLQLTYYDEELILLSGRKRNAADEFRTWVFSTDPLRCLYTLDGRYFFDRNNRYLYKLQDDQLGIYQLNVPNLKKNSQLAPEMPYWISSDAKRCCFLSDVFQEAEGQRVKYYRRVSVYDVNHMEKALFEADVEGNDFPMFQMDTTMDTIIYEDKNKTVHIEKIDGSSQQSISFDQEDEIYSVAIDDSGDTAAISYSCGNFFISIYDIHKKSLIQKIPVASKEIFVYPAMHMEMNNGSLFISNTVKSCLLDIQDGSATVQHYYKRCLFGNCPFQKCLTEDGLFFRVTDYSDGKPVLNRIYDMESGACILELDGVIYDYDASTGYLAYQRKVGLGFSPTVTIMKRDQSGEFHEVWSIKSEHADMTLNDAGKSLNGNLLLLSGKETCELYDLESQYKIMETGFPNFTLQNQKLYYPAWDSDGQLLNWVPWENQDVLQEMAAKQLGGRRFSAKERERYYILDDEDDFGKSQ